MGKKAETVNWIFVGNRLTNLMRERHMNVSKLAEKLNVGVNTLYRYRQGKTAIPPDVFEKIMIIFDVPIEEFLEDGLQPKGERSLQSAIKKLEEINRLLK